MIKAILFDLGNTLVKYYKRGEFEPILEQSIHNILDELDSRNITTVSFDSAMQNAVKENHESKDFKVTPINERFERIFNISINDQVFNDLLCILFLEPIFSVSKIYNDTIPVLKQLRDSGYKAAIVSNTPWGSPSDIWREEIRRLGLTELVDFSIFCVDVGWRKPHPKIFQYAVNLLGVLPEECVFTGDEPEWDYKGSADFGIRPVLIDRDWKHPEFKGEVIRNLDELSKIL
jgi:putative hydrolase of the HAD superfamily